MTQIRGDFILEGLIQVAEHAALTQNSFHQHKSADAAFSTGSSSHSPEKSPKELLRKHPETAKIFDRYLSLVDFETSPEGLKILVPTSFHARRIEQVRGQIENALKQSLAAIEVRQDSSTNQRNNNDPLFAWKKGAEASHLQAAPSRNQQINIAMPPERRVVDQRQLERSRRLLVPAVVQSPSVEVVYKMSQSWTEQVNMGARSQCLWVFGQPGSGKSYLVKQIHEWANLNKRLVHVNVASFFQEWRHALNNNDALSFIRKYRRDTDILILENLEDLQGKTGTQQEVLLTISALLDKGASVVVTTGSNPVMLREILPPALFSRLFSGLSFEMPSPDRLFKERLWRSLIEQNGLTSWPLDIRVLDRIFNLPLETPRKVHTFFINVIGRLSLTKQLSLADLQEIEALHGPRKKSVVESECLNPTDLIERVTKLCGVSLSALQGGSRRPDITMARRFVCLSLSRFLGLTNAVIAQYLEKDPSAVSRALSSIEGDLEKKRHIAQQWNWLCDELGVSVAVRG